MGVSRCVWEGAGRVVPPGFPIGHAVAFMEDGGGIFLPACQLAGLAPAGLLLPSAFSEWAFGTELLSVLAQGNLAAFACALMAAVWNYQNHYVGTKRLVHRISKLRLYLTTRPSRTAVA